MKRNVCVWLLIFSLLLSPIPALGEANDAPETVPPVEAVAQGPDASEAEPETVPPVEAAAQGSDASEAGDTPNGALSAEDVTQVPDTSNAGANLEDVPPVDMKDTLQTPDASDVLFMLEQNMGEDDLPKNKSPQLFKEADENASLMNNETDAFSNSDNLFLFDLYTVRDDQADDPALIYKVEYTSAMPSSGSFTHLNESGYYDIYADLLSWAIGQARFSIRFADSSMSEKYRVLAYQGLYDTEEEALQDGAENFASQLWNQPNMAETGGILLTNGHMGELLPVFTMFFYENDTLVHSRIVSFSLNTPSISSAPYDLYADTESGRMRAATISYAGEEDAVQIYEFYTRPGMKQTNHRYYIGLPILVTIGKETSVGEVNRFIYGATFGETLQDYGQNEDIHYALFSDASQPGGGCLIDFSDGPVNLVILNTQKLTHMRLILHEADDDPDNPEAPLIPIDNETPLTTDNIAYNLYHQIVNVECFNADGSYAIPLEENPYFPYEVQFILDGELTTEEWFMSPDDTVTVGGHKFSVSFSGTARHIAFLVGDERVPAYPEEKWFRNDGAAPPATREMALNAYMMESLWGNLKNVTLDGIPAGAKISWGLGLTGDTYTRTGESLTVDLTDKGLSAGAERLRLVVGTGSQLSADDYRYNIHFYFYGAQELFLPEVYTNAQPRQEIQVYQSQVNDITKDILGYSVYSVVVPGGYLSNPVWFSLRFAHPESMRDTDVAVYSGLYDSEEEALAAGAENITSKIWDVGNIAKYGGVLDDYTPNILLSSSPSITLVFRQNGVVSDVQSFRVELEEDSISINHDSYLYAGNDIWREYAAGYTGGGVTQSLYDGFMTMYEYRFTTYSNRYPTNGVYYVNLKAFSFLSYADGWDMADVFDLGLKYIDWAFPEQTQFFLGEDKNIKEQLFSDASQGGGGYPLEFRNGEAWVSVQDMARNQHWIHFILSDVAPEGETPVEPLNWTPRNRDLSFDVAYAYNDKKAFPDYSEVFFADDDYDSYYLNGYQTIFQGNQFWDSESGGYVNAPLKNGDTIYPYFHVGKNLKMFAGMDATSGTEQISRETPILFTSGKPIPYSASITDGEHLGNYWVTFVTPQSGGAKLFVNAASNADEHHREKISDKLEVPVREVMMDRRYEYHHDILFANIGDAPLKGLYVKLSGDPDGNGAAENVRLDEYYTIEEDSELGTFIENFGWSRAIGKIRLLPGLDENGFPANGDIRGYLTIGSKDTGEKVVIKLTGQVGEPVITTRTLATLKDGQSHAVKYVHYSTFLQTSSMYYFNRPSFEVVSGSLPKGRAGANLDVTLKRNGEIYGVPEETGTFTFTVRATFYGNDEIFDEKTYTLRVVENTDENVNYGTGISDYPLFQSKPEDYMPGVEYDPDAGDLILHYDEDFKLFVWRITLDGKELTPGEDYTAIDGSTEATIRSQSIRAAGSGTHTISVENRAGGLSNLKTTLTRQSVNVTTKSAGSGNSNGGGGSSGGSGSSGGGSGSSGGGSSGSSSGGSSSRSSGGNNSSTGSGGRKYNINVSSASNGTLTVNPSSAAKGEKVTITAKPNSGYRVQSVRVVGTNVSGDVDVSGSGNAYTFTMPGKQVTVRATFSPIAYSVTTASISNGTLQTSVNAATSGTTVSVSATPNKGYEIRSVSASANGNAVSLNGSGGRYTFAMPSGNVTVRAEFAVKRLATFQDIQGPDWFFDDAVWAYSYKDGILRGYSETEWRPSTSIHSVSVAVTLRRMDGADLTPYYTGADDGLDNSAWYVAAARWANANGIFQPDVPFNGYMPMTRGEYAVILRNYLRYRGINVTPAEPVSFLDAEQMTSDELDAFRVLNEAGVFQGDSSGAMLPKSSLKRSHLAALLHRLSQYIIKTESAGEGT